MHGGGTEDKSPGGIMSVEVEKRVVKIMGVELVHIVVYHVGDIQE